MLQCQSVILVVPVLCIYNTTNNFTCISILIYNLYDNIASGQQQQQYSNVRVGQSVNSNKKKYKKQVSGLRTRILAFYSVQLRTIAAQGHKNKTQITTADSHLIILKDVFSCKFNRMNPGKYSMNFDAFCHALEPIFRPRLLFTF